jgi:hypothetical protein
VPFAVVDACHIRVVCDGCRTSAEVCGKRDPPVAAVVSAVRKFKATGWHHDVGRNLRQRSIEDAERTGAGRWYCPSCGRNTHL